MITAAEQMRLRAFSKFVAELRASDACVGTCEACELESEVCVDMPGALLCAECAFNGPDSE